MIANNYQKKSLIASAVFLALAVLSKFYSGPHWRFADAYLGDVFIVACLYFILSCIFPGKKRIVKFTAIAVFAAAIELFQSTGVPASLNLPRPFVFILGSVFDIVDFMCYFIGLLLAVAVDSAFFTNEN